MDDGLRRDMEVAAAELAAPELDYSYDSLYHLQRLLERDPDDAELARRAGAYLGEVLVRHGVFEWFWPPIGDPAEPGLLAGDGSWTLPFERVRFARGPHHRDDTLVTYAREMVEFSYAPDDDTARRLGWTKQPAVPARRSKPWLAGWDRLPRGRRIVGALGAGFIMIALILLPGGLADKHFAAGLAERGVTTTATRVRAHVGDQAAGPRLDAVEVTFTTSDGRSVTTELIRVTGHDTTATLGWHDTYEWPDYEQPLRIRYDAAEPTVAMAESDYEFERDFPFLGIDLAMLAVGVVLTMPAVRALRRAAA